MELPAIRTPETAAALRAALGKALPDVSPLTLDYFTAHVLIETGGGKSVVQHNVGNLIVTRSNLGSRDYWRPPWFEPGPDASPLILRLHEQMIAGEQPEAFAAYATLEDGAEAFAALMQRPRYAALRNATTPEAYVQAWRDTGYTPDLNVGATLKTFRSILGVGPRSAARGGSGFGLVLLGLAAGAFVVSRRR